MAGQGTADRPRRRMVLLTEGHCADPVIAKTASCLLRYCPDEVDAILDTTAAGRSAADVLGVGGAIPVIGRLAAAPHATHLVIGIAPPGGRVPDAWRPVLLEALGRGMTVVSGLHDFLSDDPEVAAAAARHGARIVDVRRNDERDVASRLGIREECTRILTIGTDCSIGKMVAAVELTRGLGRRGVDAKFVATGQTGIMVEGDGCPIDRVIADFVNGAVEKLVLANQHHDVLVVEGQATITHPRYSGVSLGLLHGAMPHGMILVHEPGRVHHGGLPHVALPSLERVIAAYETMAEFSGGGKVIGVALNTRSLDAAAAAVQRRSVADRLGLPTADPVRDGSDDLVAAVERLHRERRAGTQGGSA